MKKIHVILLALTLSFSVLAQTPEKMSYQAVVKDATNALIKDAKVGIQVSILQGSITGSAVYTETHVPTTNANGVISVEIGRGTVLTGVFSGIDWSAGPYFIKTETDPNGGTNYSISGTQQLLSVPYALYAKTAQSAKVAETVTNDAVDDADADATNEIQNLSISGQNLSISGGNTVTLPTLPAVIVHQSHSAGTDITYSKTPVDLPVRVTTSPSASGNSNCLISFTGTLIMEGNSNGGFVINVNGVDIEDSKRFASGVGGWTIGSTSYYASNLPANSVIKVRHFSAQGKQVYWGKKTIIVQQFPN